MFLNTTSFIPFLLALSPVVILSLPTENPTARKSLLDLKNWEPIHDSVEFTMNELSGNRTICPFIVENKTTGGIPEIITIYSCVSQTTSESTAVDNNIGRCTKNHECYQGTTTILILKPNTTEPVPEVFNSGCFCAQQKGSLLEKATPPKITN
ncbi:hypothetical protein LSTR_LSTR013293 [Laodelphax striatellus]|uniref:Spaetzle domain-containing protein n=1 Tax=Laodelphax striatellus TaxID=195883 RepID=A0A482X3Y1_LAOST|nr:hypothetical protein LSTR_LSTR013293 [Laodelphax striatellus]